MRTEAEVYRFTWRSSFDGDAAVRIGAGDEMPLAVFIAGSWWR